MLKLRPCRSVAVLAIALIGGGCASQDPTSNGTEPAADDSAEAAPLELAFVTNNPSDFWMIAKAGVMQAETEFNLKCEIRMPANGTAAEQQQIVEDLMTKGVAGMAISPKDSANQTELINKAAEMMKVICHDSDAPQSNRVAYVGSNNVKAGQAAGELMKEALPNGGKIMLFVGSLDAQNAVERKQGVESALADSGIEILGIRTDETDRPKAIANVEDALTSHPDISGFIGLWSYNAPAILEAVKRADKLGKIVIVGFDEEEPTLKGVQDGHIYGTVVQDPYMFGYQSMKILAHLIRGEDAGIPENKLVEIPVLKVLTADVGPFRDQLQERLSAAKGE